ncbi:MAG TPA: hypothetical protein VL481_03735 [Verrucomicrobiae bacterium]|jgi:hypothetical protein|nr:hypothetical protein [Verrucomicrobiae bacterium]
MTATTASCTTPVQPDAPQAFDQTDRDRAQHVMFQLGTYLGTAFRVVCSPRGAEGHLVFHIQDTRSMQTATIDPMGTLTMGNIHQPHLRPAEMMLDEKGLTVWAFRELAGVFMRQLTPDNTPKHLHGDLFDAEALLAQQCRVTSRPDQRALLHVYVPEV